MKKKILGTAEKNKHGLDGDRNRCFSDLDGGRNAKKRELETDVKKECFYWTRRRNNDKFLVLLP